MALSVSGFPEPVRQPGEVFSGHSSSNNASTSGGGGSGGDDGHGKTIVNAPRLRGFFGNASSSSSSSSSANPSSSSSSSSKPAPVSPPLPVHRPDSEPESSGLKGLSFAGSSFEPLSQQEYEKELRLQDVVDEQTRGTHHHNHNHNHHNTVKRAQLPPLPRRTSPSPVRLGASSSMSKRLEIGAGTRSVVSAHAHSKSIPPPPPPPAVVVEEWTGDAVTPTAKSPGLPRPLPTVPFPEVVGNAVAGPSRSNSVGASSSSASSSSSAGPSSKVLITQPTPSHRQNTPSVSMRYQPLVVEPDIVSPSPRPLPRIPPPSKPTNAVASGSGTTHSPVASSSSSSSRVVPPPAKVKRPRTSPSVISGFAAPSSSSSGAGPSSSTPSSSNSASTSTTGVRSGFENIPSSWASRPVDLNASRPNSPPILVSSTGKPLPLPLKTGPRARSHSRGPRRDRSLDSYSRMTVVAGQQHVLKTPASASVATFGTSSGMHGTSSTATTPTSTSTARFRSAPSPTVAGARPLLRKTSGSLSARPSKESVGSSSGSSAHGITTSRSQSRTRAMSSTSATSNSTSASTSSASASVSLSASSSTRRPSVPVSGPRSARTTPSTTPTALVPPVRFGVGVGGPPSHSPARAYPRQKAGEMPRMPMPLSSPSGSSSTSTLTPKSKPKSTMPSSRGTPPVISIQTQGIGIGGVAVYPANQQQQHQQMSSSSSQRMAKQGGGVPQHRPGHPHRFHSDTAMGSTRRAAKDVDPATLRTLRSQLQHQHHQQHHHYVPHPSSSMASSSGAMSHLNAAPPLDISHDKENMSPDQTSVETPLHAHPVDAFADDDSLMHPKRSPVEEVVVDSPLEFGGVSRGGVHVGAAAPHAIASGVDATVVDEDECLVDAGVDGDAGLSRSPSPIRYARPPADDGALSDFEAEGGGGYDLDEDGEEWMDGPLEEVGSWEVRAGGETSDEDDYGDRGRVTAGLGSGGAGGRGRRLGSGRTDGGGGGESESRSELSDEDELGGLSAYSRRRRTQLRAYRMSYRPRTPGDLPDIPLRGRSPEVSSARLAAKAPPASSNTALVFGAMNNPASSFVVTPMMAVKAQPSVAEKEKKRAEKEEKKRKKAAKEKEKERKEQERKEKEKEKEKDKDRFARSFLGDFGAGSASGSASAPATRASSPERKGRPRQPRRLAEAVSLALGGGIGGSRASAPAIASHGSGSNQHGSSSHGSSAHGSMSGLVPPMPLPPSSNSPRTHSFGQSSAGAPMDYEEVLDISMPSLARRDTKMTDETSQSSVSNASGSSKGGGGGGGGGSAGAGSGGGGGILKTKVSMGALGATKKTWTPGMPLQSAMKKDTSGANANVNANALVHASARRSPSRSGASTSGTTDAEDLSAADTPFMWLSKNKPPVKPAPFIPPPPKSPGHRRMGSKDEQGYALLTKESVGAGDGKAKDPKKARRRTASVPMVYAVGGSGGPSASPSHSASGSASGHHTPNSASASASGHRITPNSGSVSAIGGPGTAASRMVAIVDNGYPFVPNADAPFISTLVEMKPHHHQHQHQPQLQPQRHPSVRKRAREGPEGTWVHTDLSSEEGGGAALTMANASTSELGHQQDDVMVVKTRRVIDNGEYWEDQQQSNMKDVIPKLRTMKADR